MSEIHLHGITPVVLNPGDKVLVSLTYAFSMQEMDHVKAYLVDRFPGVEFALLCGVESVTVQRAEESTDGR
jgi:hypothetical protein